MHNRLGFELSPAQQPADMDHAQAHGTSVVESTALLPSAFNLGTPRPPVHYLTFGSNAELENWLEANEESAGLGECRIFEFELPLEMPPMQHVAIGAALGRQLADRYGFSVEATMRTNVDTGAVYFVAVADVLGSDFFGGVTLLGEFECTDAVREELDWIRGMAASTIALHLKQEDAFAVMPRPGANVWDVLRPH